MKLTVALLAVLFFLSWQPAAADEPTADQVLRGLRDFYQKTARPDGSFAPGIDPDYLGMSDSAFSDLAPVTYAVTIHRTFGWKLPHEDKTVAFLLSRQKQSGEFFNVAGTVDPDSPAGKAYNTTQALVALHALGVKPKYDPLPVFEQIGKKQEYKSLPPYMTSFFPLAYLCTGRPIPPELDRAIRATMIQDNEGYLDNHVAATFHASHYYQLVGEPTPKAKEMVARTLAEQKPDGSWLLNLPSRDRHATFDAVFTLVHEGGSRPDCRDAVARAAKWALSCRNADGGFGHFPGSTSDADANYFQAGTLVMAGFLKPADPVPPDPHLLSWGHLMPVTKVGNGPDLFRLHVPGWIAGVAFSPDGKTLAVACSDRTVRLWNWKTGGEPVVLRGHTDAVACVQFSPDGKTVASGGYDHTARLWDAASGELRATLSGHRGVVMCVGFSPDGALLATGSVDSTIRLWTAAGGKLVDTLTGHKSWVNALAFHPNGKELLSASSDGTVKVWPAARDTATRTVNVSKAEVRSLAVAPDGKTVAVGLRYGQIKLWDAATWQERLAFQGHVSDVWSVAFSPDGKQLLSGNGDWNAPGPVKLWDAATGRLLGQRAHTGEVLAVAFSPTGSAIATGGGDQVVSVWEVK